MKTYNEIAIFESIDNTKRIETEANLFMEHLRKTKNDLTIKGLLSTSQSHSLYGGAPITTTICIHYSYKEDVNGTN